MSSTPPPGTTGAADLAAEAAEFTRGGLHGLLGLRYDRVTGDRVEASLEVDARHHQPMGLVHGGVYAALVESAGSVGAWVRLRGSGDVAVGVHNATDFLRPHSEGVLRVVAEPVHVGRTQQLWLVVVSRDVDGKVVARGQVRLQVLRGAEF
jgi:1,4-dihydroxy-2-naphthoyl-CoA hydrolase